MPSVERESGRARLVAETVLARGDSLPGIITGFRIGAALYGTLPFLVLLAEFCIGNALAIPLGIAIALNRRLSDLLHPLPTFLQSIAGTSGLGFWMIEAV